MITTIFSIILFFNSQTADVVDKLQEKFLGIETLKADFLQSTSSGTSISGKFYFKKRNKHRIELDNNIIISDGQTIWNKNLERKKVVISNLEEDPLSFSLPDYILNFPTKCKVTEEKHKDGYLLTFEPNDSALNFKLAELWINEGFNIDKIKVFDFGGNYFIFQFKNIVINNDLPEKLFQYHDDGTEKIIDLR